MTETRLTRSVAVYRFLALLGPAHEIRGSRSIAVFGGDTEPQFELDSVVWRRMGQPKQITVTVESGDGLNAPPAWSSCSNPACTAAHTRSHPLVETACSGCGG